MGFYMQQGLTTEGALYKVGNVINTNLGERIPYQWMQPKRDTQAFGATGAYVTVKSPQSSFFLVADLDGVDSFFVNGMLDMTEGVQETMSFLVTTKSAESGAVPTQWMVSCKASCGSPDGPSVNHIIMTSVDQASVLESSTTISSSVQSDYHLVDRLSGSKRLMYALFAGQKNHCFGEEDFKSYTRDALLAAHSSVVPVMGVESIVTLHKNNTIVQKNVPFGVEDLIELHSKESQDGQQNGGSSSNLALILGVVFGSVAAIATGIVVSVVLVRRRRSTLPRENSAQSLIAIRIPGRLSAPEAGMDSPHSESTTCHAA